MLPGKSSWPAAATPAADPVAAGACMRPTASGMENHCGAERPKSSAKSMAAVSKRSCRPVARYRSNRLSQVSSWSLRAPCGPSTSIKPASAPASSPLAKRMARLFQLRVVRELLHVDGERLGRGKTHAGASGLRDRAGMRHCRECGSRDRLLNG